MASTPQRQEINVKNAKMLGTITAFCGEYDKFTNIGKNLNFFLGLQQFIYQVSSLYFSAANVDSKMMLASKQSEKYRYPPPPPGGAGGENIR